jgi:hypothetical protein
MHAVHCARVHSRYLTAVLCLLLAACSGMTRRATPGTPAPAAGEVPSAVMYVARRGWHTDIGFAAADLSAPLSSLATDFPGARYLFFGFGDSHYLMAKKHQFPAMLAALWPGAGMILATGLTAPPQKAFGGQYVLRLSVTPAQSRAAQAFVWESLLRRNATGNAGGNAEAGASGNAGGNAEAGASGNASGNSEAGVTGNAGGNAIAGVYAAGPYQGSLYYESEARYSALHTCNTWTAEALKSAGLPVRSGGVIFAGQLWPEAARLPTAPAVP